MRDLHGASDVGANSYQIFRANSRLVFYAARRPSAPGRINALRIAMPNLML